MKVRVLLASSLIETDVTSWFHPSYGVDHL